MTISAAPLANFCGFETASTVECSSVTTSSGTVSIVTSPVHGAGAYALRTQTTTGTGSAYASIGGPNRTSLGITGLCYRRFYFYCTALPASGSAEIWSATQSEGGAEGSKIVFLRLKADGTLRYSSTQFDATGSTVIVPGRWYCIELQLSFNLGSQPWELRIDGVTELSGTLGGTSLSNAALWGDQLGKTLTSTDSGSGIDFCYDDFACSPASTSGGTWIGPGQCSRVMVPVGAGTASAWTSSSGTAYQDVDEVPPNDDTDYISVTAGATGAHTFAMADSPVVPQTINAIKNTVDAKRTAGVGATAVKTRILSGATASEANSNWVNGSYVTSALLANTDPNTSAAWAKAAIDALECGVNKAGTTNAVQATAVYLTMDYVPSPAIFAAGANQMLACGGPSV